MKHVDESQISEVYSRMLEDLIRLCRILLNYEMVQGVEAEDVVQRVVLRALEQKGRLEKHKNLCVWFVKACRQECNTLCRRSRVERRKLGISQPLEPEIEKQQDELIQWLRQREMNELLDALKERLTPLEKSVYNRYYEQDQSAADVAHALNIKQNAVNDAARRIRKKAAGLLLGLLLLCVQNSLHL